MAKEKDEKDESDTTRWGDRRRAQLGYINNLVLTLSVGAIAFICDKIADEHVELILAAKIACVLSAAVLLLSSFMGILLAYNRLVDLRETAKIVKYKADIHLNAGELKCMREENTATGNKTWCLLRWQMGTFLLGLLGVVTLFSLIYYQKLF